MMGKPSTALLVFSAIVIFSSCSDPSSWYPSGSAEIVSVYDIGDITAMACTMTVKITNTGRSKISASFVSLSVTTGTRSYFETLSVSRDIIPGGSTFSSATIGYATPGEAMLADSAKVIDQYYE